MTADRTPLPTRIVWDATKRALLAVDAATGRHRDITLDVARALDEGGVRFLPGAYDDGLGGEP